MAEFLRNQIEALRRPSINHSISQSMSPSPPVLSVSDDLLCPSPPVEDEDDVRGISVMDTIRQNAIYLRPEDYPNFHPPVQSQFSAWSSATTMDMDANRVDSPAHSSEDEDITAMAASHTSGYFGFSIPPNAPVDDASNGPLQPTLTTHTPEPTSPSELPLPLTPPSRPPSHELNCSSSQYAPRTPIAHPQPIKHVFHLSLERNDPAKPKLFSVPQRPAITTPQFTDIISEYFPKASPMSGALKSNTILDAISPFDGAAISKIHRIFVQSPRHLMVEGQMFEMCGS
jgi:hypothetical protein